MDLENLSSKLKILYTGCLGLSPTISAQFTSEMRVAARNRKKLLKPVILRVQGYSRSSMLTFLRSSLPVHVMISSTSVFICNHFHVRRANNGRITLLKGGCPCFSPSFVGTPFIQWHEILSQNTRNSKLSHGKKKKSLTHLGSDRYRVVTDTKTELPYLIPGMLALARNNSICAVNVV